MPVSGIAARTDGLLEQAEESQAKAWPDRAPGPEGPAGALDEPEILGAPGGLSASDFFTPRMWGLALVPLFLAMTIAQLSAVRFADTLRLWGGAVYEEVFFQPSGVGWYAAHLLPFGIPVRMDINYGQQYLTVILQTSPVAGLLALLAGFLVVIAYTKNSNDGIHACGPYAAYSLLAVLVAWRTGPFYDVELREGDLGALFYAMLAAVLAPILAAVLAKLAAVAMRNGGMFDIDEDGQVFDDEPLAYAGTPAAAPAPAPGRKGRRRRTSGEGLFTAPAPGDGRVAEEAGPERQAVARAVVCPWCGSHRASPDKPGPCPSCHKNLALAFEWSNGARCIACRGILVRDSAFCHHCGKWQQAGEDPGPDGAE